ncbi:MAG TPA: LysR family transcriptional regulator [Planctomycetia bacterium]|nr:LysR family transcriptional regulator [Planctomycetia bacterium]
MNVDALRVFCEVARQRSFSRAAAFMEMTQSAASQAVQQLEKELGQQLFDRSRRPPELTPPGERFFATCRDVLEQLDRAVAEMKALGSEVAGPVSVASIYSVGLYHVESIAKFMRDYPRVTVRLQYLRPNLVVDAVLSSEATLGLISYPQETKELSVVPWREEEMVLVTPPDHPLGALESASIEDLEDQPFVGFDPDLAIRKRIDSALAKHRVSVRMVLEFDNIETLKQAILVGNGIGILPAETVRQAAAAGQVKTVPLRNSEMVRPVGVIYRRGKALPAAAVKFIETLTGRPFAPQAPAAARKPEPVGA